MEDEQKGETLLFSIAVAGIQQRSVHAAKNNTKLKDRVYTRVCILHGEEKPHSPGGRPGVCGDDQQVLRPPGGGSLATITWTAHPRAARSPHLLCGAQAVGPRVSSQKLGPGAARPWAPANGATLLGAAGTRVQAHVRESATPTILHVVPGESMQMRSRQCR